MGSSVVFFADNAERQELLSFAQSLGLSVVPTVLGQLASEPEVWAGPFCYLSLVPEHELKTFGASRDRISAAQNPLLGFVRPYHLQGRLVLGQLQWLNDVPELAVQTRAAFKSLSRWIGSNWPRKEGADYHIGPRANDLAKAGAELINLFPGTASFELVRRRPGDRR